MKTIDEDKFGEITLDEDSLLLTLTWFPETADMTADDFKRSLVALAEAVENSESPAVIVDVRDFRSEAAMQIDDWRIENIVPRYNKHLHRFAWVAGASKPPELPGGGEEYQNDGETYKNRWFRDLEAAAQWATNEA